MNRPRADALSQNAIPLVPLAILLFSVMGVYASTYLLLSVLPVHIRNLGNSEASVGSIMSLFSLAALFTRPFAGVATDRIGRRPSIFVGGIIIGLSNIGYAITGAHTIFLARLLNGVGWGAVTATTATVAADLAPPTKRGTILGIYGTVTGAAFAIGPGAGIWLGDHVGLKVAFLIASACGFAAAIGILFLRTQAPRPAIARSRLSIGHFYSPPATGPAMIMFCWSLVYGAVLTFVPLLTIDRGLGSSGTFFAVFAVALIFLRISGGSLSDRLGRYKVIVPGFLSSAVAMVVLARAHSNPVLLVAAILFAAAFAFIQPAAQAWSVDLSPAHLRGTTLATVIAAQDLGISAGTFLAGLIANAFGYTELFSLAATVSAFGIAAVWFTYRRASATVRQPVPQ